MVSVSEAFDRIPFFQGLSVEERERLQPYATIRVLRRGERLWEDLENTKEFAFVVRGRFKMFKTLDNGKETILEMGGAGDLLCANAVSSFTPFCCTGASMENDTEVLIIPRRDILELIERSPEGVRAFVREVTGRCRNLCSRVEELGSGQVEQRISMLLLRLAERTGIKRNDGGLRIPVPLSRQDLADLCGTTIETSIRVMSRFRKKGVIESSGRGFIVHDLSELERLALGRSALAHQALQTTSSAKH